MGALRKKKFYRWTPALAYIVGLVTTDGNLSPDKRHIQFTTTDYQLAKVFKSCLGSSCKIISSPPSGFGRKRAYRINIGDITLYHWLERIGLTPRKSSSLGPLKIPDKYFADFLRGHLDGDGSVFTYRDRYLSYKGKRYVYLRLYTQFISASSTHIKWIRSKLTGFLNMSGSLNNYIKSGRTLRIWQLRFAKKDSLKLLKWLYYKPGLPCLKRKRKIAEQFL